VPLRPAAADSAPRERGLMYDLAAIAIALACFVFVFALIYLFDRV
jgi:hypothetical protein